MVATAALALQGCGQREPVSRGYYAPIRSYSTGPVSRACMASDRKQRSDRLCGCIQAVADRSLSSSEQSTAVGFFRDPHRAQIMRQSDRSGDERTWRNYKTFVDRAERSCRGL